jgi:hypothetical protein
MNERQPLTQHPVMQAIQSSVSHLVVPDLAPLLVVFMDMQADRQMQRGELQQQMETLRLDAQDAATRLMLPDVEQLKAQQAPYFSQVKHTRGPHDE